MGYFNEFFGVDVGTGETIIVDSLDVSVGDDSVDIEVLSDATIEIVNETINVEVC